MPAKKKEAPTHTIGVEVRFHGVVRVVFEEEGSLEEAIQRAMKRAKEEPIFRGDVDLIDGSRTLTGLSVDSEWAKLQECP